MNRRQFLLAAAMAGRLPAFAESETVYRSAAQRTAVLELFTSEGCSSCPPAEEWFSGLRNATGLWTHFIPMAFHVDYWDYLGWKDAFATPAFSRRQHLYAAKWRSGTVYTPGFVMNGGEWRGKSLVLPSATMAGVLTCRHAADAAAWAVEFEPADGNRENLVFHTALLGSASSKVTAGENAGRTLRHDFTVLNHTSAKAAGGQARLAPASDERATALVAWASRGDDPTPLQAAGGWLSKSPK